MSVRVDLVAKHSGSKDHLAMTGGTLSADKVVRGDESLVLQHEFFPVARFGRESRPEELRRIFAGIHSIEHALASPEGGDLRARLDEVASEPGAGADDGATPGRRLLDMSPYVPGLRTDEEERGEPGGGAGAWVVGFRSTVVSDGELLEPEVMAEAYRRSLAVIRELFASGGKVPFSEPEACGQYDLHSARAAVELLDGVGDPEGEHGINDGEGKVRTGSGVLYVCDLRLVKPRLPEAFEQRMLDLLGGHHLSQEVEAGAWRFLPGGHAGSVTAGNFGCSTGEYLMVTDAADAGQERALRDAHVAVAKTLAELADYQGSDDLRRVAADDARFALEHIERHSPEIWGAAA